MTLCRRNLTNVKVFRKCIPYLYLTAVNSAVNIIIVITFFRCDFFLDKVQMTYVRKETLIPCKKNKCGNPS